MLDYAVGIRCHNISTAEIFLLDLLSEVLNRDKIFFLLDNRSGKLKKNPTDRPIIAVDQHVGRFASPSDWGWRCGDFFYYAFQDFVMADRYYLIEPDVTFGKETGDFIFKYMQSIDSDFMAFNLGKGAQDWYWFKTIRCLFVDVYKCAFPLTMLSWDAVRYLCNQRMNASLSIVNLSEYPNDEAFVATHIACNPNFKWHTLNKIPNLRLDRFSTVNARPIELCREEGRIYHSALPVDDFVEKLTKIILKLKDDAKIKNTLNFSFSGADDQFISFFEKKSNNLISHHLNRWINNE